ncbi:hypothetical protein AB0N99_36345 [Streptomyces sp. NPDC093272]|uniref:hypothetical protein n=1 Tax=Streptomyces sp. NPDC093272 TaxID=3154981 RepID=UPI0034438D67
MNISWGNAASLSAAGLSAVAAAGAWLAAHRSANTADAVARIEQDRWHADLLPQFNITLGPMQGDHATLGVHLAGPLPLCRLDEIRVEIVQSDDMNYRSEIAGGRTAEETDAQVWGPLRFSHGANGADINGKTVEPFPLAVGQGHPFSVELTRPPSWIEGNDRMQRWQERWAGMPVRMVLTCRREGFKAWVVPYEVDIPQGR